MTLLLHRLTRLLPLLLLLAAQVLPLVHDRRAVTAFVAGTAACTNPRCNCPSGCPPGHCCCAPDEERKQNAGTSLGCLPCNRNDAFPGFGVEAVLSTPPVQVTVASSLPGGGTSPARRHPERYLPPPVPPPETLPA